MGWVYTRVYSWDMLVRDAHLFLVFSKFSPLIMKRSNYVHILVNTMPELSIPAYTSYLSAILIRVLYSSFVPFVLALFLDHTESGMKQWWVKFIEEPVENRAIFMRSLTYQMVLLREILFPVKSCKIPLNRPLFTFSLTRAKILIPPLNNLSHSTSFNLMLYILFSLPHRDIEVARKARETGKTHGIVTKSESPRSIKKRQRERWQVQYDPNVCIPSDLLKAPLSSYSVSFTLHVTRADKVMEVKIETEMARPNNGTSSSSSSKKRVQARSVHELYNSAGLNDNDSFALYFYYFLSLHLSSSLSFFKLILYPFVVDKKDVKWENGKNERFSDYYVGKLMEIEADDVHCPLKISSINGTVFHFDYLGMHVMNTYSCHALFSFILLLPYSITLHSFEWRVGRRLEFRSPPPWW